MTDVPLIFVWNAVDSRKCTVGYSPQNVCKLQSSYICGEFKNQIKNNEAYNGTKIGNYFGNGLK